MQVEEIQEVLICIMQIHSMQTLPWSLQFMSQEQYRFHTLTALRRINTDTTSASSANASAGTIPPNLISFCQTGRRIFFSKFHCTTHKFAIITLLSSYFLQSVFGTQFAEIPIKQEPASRILRSRAGRPATSSACLKRLHRKGKIVKALDSYSY